MSVWFVGRTMFEAQVGPFWLKILRPGYWGLKNRMGRLPLVRVGYDRTWRS